MLSQTSPNKDCEMSGTVTEKTLAGYCGDSVGVGFPRGKRAEFLMGTLPIGTTQYTKYKNMSHSVTRTVGPFSKVLWLKLMMERKKIRLVKIDKIMDHSIPSNVETKLSQNLSCQFYR